MARRDPGIGAARPASQTAALLVVMAVLGSGCAAPEEPTAPPGAAMTPATDASATPSPPRASMTAVATTPEPEAGVHISQVVVLPTPTAGVPADAGPAATAPAGAASTASAAARAFVPAESVDTVDKRLNVTLDGTTTYIRNGGRVELGNGLAVEIYLDPYPPTSLHSVMDLYLTEGGEPVADASIDVEFDMLSMAHGPFVATAKEIGGGHHLATLDYIMFGAWDQFVTIRRGLERIRFPVVIVAYP